MKQVPEEILHLLEDGILAIDSEGKTLFQNEAASQLLKDGSPTWEEKCREKLLQALHTEERIVETLTSPERCINLMATPISHGAFLVLQDKTADYRTIEREKDFIVNAAHELRTPFTVVRGFAETLCDFPDLSKKVRQEIVEKMVHTCSRLDRVLRSLLTLADVEVGSEDRFSRFELGAVMQECAKQLLTLYPGLHLQLDPIDAKGSFWIRGDRELIVLALMNILENGIRYSEPPAQIRMALRKNGNYAALSVIDRGIGIPDSDLSRIFQRFYTVDKERSRKSGGAGLGLSIVQTILEKHQGNIQVLSTVGQGSSFTLQLPLSV